MERMEDYDINEAWEDFIKRMQDDGYAIVRPESNEIQIDIDTEEHYEAFLAAVEILERNNVFSFSVCEIAPNQQTVVVDVYPINQQEK